MLANGTRASVLVNAPKRLSVKKIKAVLEGKAAAARIANRSDGGEVLETVALFGGKTVESVARMSEQVSTLARLLRIETLDTGGERGELSEAGNADGCIPLA